MGRIAARPRLICTMLLALALAGCGTNPFERRPERGSGAQEPAQSEKPATIQTPVNLSGYSPTFQQGYADGCTSAESRRQRRNESRYKTEADYMMGWNDGFSICQKRR